MDTKKKYVKPEIFKVNLDPSQAIIAVCHASSRRINTSKSSKWNVCKPRCKHGKQKNKNCNSTANS